MKTKFARLIQYMSHEAGQSRRGLDKMVGYATEPLDGNSEYHL